MIIGALDFTYVAAFALLNYSSMIPVMLHFHDKVTIDDV